MLKANEVTCALVSDLHLDFEDINDEMFSTVADILIIAGDTVEVRDVARKNRYAQFFKRCSENFEHVLVICGNHEYYHGAIPKSTEKFREFLKPWPNIHLLQNETFQFKGITFIGATLWTDIGKRDPIGVHNAGDLMNDFRGTIRKSDMDFLRFTPSDSIREHSISLEFFREQVKTAPGDVVVISHHAPSSLSIDARYRDQHYDNMCYYSDLSEFILNRNKIKVWCHGHVHNLFDYQIGECRVLCNPRGYPGERPSRLPPFSPVTFSIPV